jgi:hypothetical protein
MIVGDGGGGSVTEISMLVGEGSIVIGSGNPGVTVAGGLPTTALQAREASSRTTQTIHTGFIASVLFKINPFTLE